MSYLVTKMRQALEGSGFDSPMAPKENNSHSFRFGTATTATAKCIECIEDAIIQIQGNTAYL